MQHAPSLQASFKRINVQLGVVHEVKAADLCGKTVKEKKTEHMKLLVEAQNMSNVKVLAKNLILSSLFPFTVLVQVVYEMHVAFKVIDYTLE